MTVTHVTDEVWHEKINNNVEQETMGMKYLVDEKNLIPAITSS